MDCEDHVPPVKFLEPYDSNQSTSSLTLHENDAVHVQLTSGTSSSNREEEEKPPEPITGFGSRAGTTNCDASGLGGFVRRHLSTRNLRITSNFFRCTMYLVLHSVLCHCLVKQHSRIDKKKKDIHLFAGRAVKRERRKGSSRQQQPAYGAVVNEVARELLHSARSPKRENGGRRYIKHDGMIASPVSSCLCC